METLQQARRFQIPTFKPHLVNFASCRRSGPAPNNASGGRLYQPTLLYRCAASSNQAAAETGEALLKKSAHLACLPLLINARPAVVTGKIFERATWRQSPPASKKKHSRNLARNRSSCQRAGKKRKPWPHTIQSALRLADLNI